MLLNVVSNWQVLSDQPVISIPLGTEFQLKATFHDNVGNVFTTSTTVLKVRSSRMDLVRIKPGVDNSTLTVSTKKPGVTVLKVWADEILKTADYVKLNVQQSALPTVVSYLSSFFVNIVLVSVCLRKVSKLQKIRYLLFYFFIFCARSVVYIFTMRDADYNAIY